jgi:hypothetical protein
MSNIWADECMSVSYRERQAILGLTHVKVSATEKAKHF